MKHYQKAVILGLLVSLVLTVCGCKSKLSEPEFDALNLKYDLAEDERLEPFYAAETKIYATVNKHKPPNSMSALGFTVITEQFIVYDLQAQKVVAKYEPEEGGDKYNKSAISWRHVPSMINYWNKLNGCSYVSATKTNVYLGNPVFHYGDGGYYHVPYTHFTSPKTIQIFTGNRLIL